MNIEVEQAERRSIPRLWAIAAVAMAVVGAVAVVNIGRGTQAPEPSAVTLASINPETLSDQAPGFTGTLYATVLLNRNETFVRWSSDAASPELIELDTLRMRLNADQSQVAAIDFVSPVAGFLRVGPPGTEQAITTDVTAFAWHDSDPGQIAATRTLGDTSLWLGMVDPTERRLVSSAGDVPRGSVIVAFGEWGYALHSTPDNDGNLTTIVLDADGIELHRFRGQVAGSLPGPDGGVIVADPLGSELNITWSAANPSGDSVSTARGLLSVLWSDDLGSYAELSDSDTPNVDVLFVTHQTASGTVAYEFDHIAPIDWDPTGRFLAGIRRAKVVIVDVNDGSVSEIGIPATQVSDIRLGA